jgi:hypothetical protein
MRSVKSKRNMIASEASSDGNESIHSRRRRINRILSSSTCETDNEIEYNGYYSNIEDMLQEIVLKEEVEMMIILDWAVLNGKRFPASKSLLHTLTKSEFTKKIT